VKPTSPQFHIRVISKVEAYLKLLSIFEAIKCLIAQQLVDNELEIIWKIAVLAK
jgi:hypothetical protein